MVSMPHRYEVSGSARALQSRGAEILRSVTVRSIESNLVTPFEGKLDERVAAFQIIEQILEDGNHRLRNTSTQSWYRSQWDEDCGACSGTPCA
jgi:hypothetical protein